MTPPQKRLGFIGLGAMGKPMAQNIAKRLGIPINVYDVRADVLSDSNEWGAVVCSSPAEVARSSDVVFTMVPEDHHLNAAAPWSRRHNRRRPRRLRPRRLQHTGPCGPSATSTPGSRRRVRDVSPLRSLSVSPPLLQEHYRFTWIPPYMRTKICWHSSRAAPPPSCRSGTSPAPK